MLKRFALLSALMLAGCSQQPKYVQPGLPTAPAYPADAWPATAGPRPVDVDRRSFATVLAVFYVPLFFVTVRGMAGARGMPDTFVIHGSAHPVAAG